MNYKDFTKSLKEKTVAELLELLKFGQTDESKIDPDYLDSVIEELNTRDLSDTEANNFEKLITISDDATPFKLDTTQFQDEKSSKEIVMDSTMENVILTTIPNLEGYKVTKTLEIVTAECVFGMNLFKDFLAGLTDIFGGRSKTTQNTLRDARKVCLNELRKEAINVGANAVVGVKLDYSELNGQGKSMLFLVASGTAVIIEENKIQTES